jgi:hypothetical protein
MTMPLACSMTARDRIAVSRCSLRATAAEYSEWLARATAAWAAKARSRSSASSSSGPSELR